MKEEGLYSQKTVTYDTKDMEKKVVLQYSFRDDDGTALFLVRLLSQSGHEGIRDDEWKVQSVRRNVENDLLRTHGHYASVSAAVQLFSRELQKLSNSLKEEAHEEWFLPAIDTLLEDAFRHMTCLHGSTVGYHGEA